MKITAIESLQWPEYPRLLVVRVHTDEGLVGLGETVDKIPGSKGALHGTIAPAGPWAGSIRYRRLVALRHGQYHVPWFRRCRNSGALGA